MPRRYAVTLVLLTAVLAARSIAEAQTVPAYDPADPLPPAENVDPDREIAMARAAAPREVSDHATIWVLGPAGYKVAVEGTNGWGCIVQRDTTSPGLFPRCDDPASVAVNFKRFFLLEEMRASGRSQRDYEREVEARIESGQLGSPPVGAVSYMFAEGIIPPHVMIARPGCSPADLGASSVSDLAKMEGVTLLNRGMPSCSLIIYTPEDTRRKIPG